MAGKRRDDNLTKDKKCAECKEIKSPDNFGPKTQKLKDGTIRHYLTSRCYPCDQARKSRDYYANQEEAKAKDRITRAIYRAGDHRVQLWYSAKSRARIKNLPFSITVEDIIIPTHCSLLGVELKRRGKKNRDDAPSIDRIIPRLGYIPGNIAVISTRANRLKNDSSIEEVKLVLAFMERQKEINPNLFAQAEIADTIQEEVTK